jgi:hypothetical protein
MICTLFRKIRLAQTGAVLRHIRKKALGKNIRRLFLLDRFIARQIAEGAG